MGFTKNINFPEIEMKMKMHNCKFSENIRVFHQKSPQNWGDFDENSSKSSKCPSKFIRRIAENLSLYRRVQHYEANNWPRLVYLQLCMRQFLFRLLFNAIIGFFCLWRRFSESRKNTKSPSQAKCFIKRCFRMHSRVKVISWRS